MTLSDSRQHRRPRRRRGRDPRAWRASPDDPRHPPGVPCPLPRWTAAGASVGCFPTACSLPRFPAGSASTTSLSRPAQASLALRPVGSLSRPRRPLSRGFDPPGCPDKPLVSYQINRQLPGWNLPPLVTRAAALTLGQHLYSAGGDWIINIAGRETKNGREYEVPYPAILVPYLERYLDHWRPALLVGAADSDRLWISWRGYPLDYQDIHRIIRAVTAKLFGTPMHPHIFRDCLATCVALMTRSTWVWPRLSWDIGGSRRSIGSTIRPNRARRQRPLQANLLRRRRAARRAIVEHDAGGHLRSASSATRSARPRSRIRSGCAASSPSGRAGRSSRSMPTMP